jgi:hypothetical protein
MEEAIAYGSAMGIDYLSHEADCLFFFPASHL